MTNGNRAVYERWIQEVWSQGNVAQLDELLASDFVDHQPIPQYPGNRAGHAAMAADFHAAFPDIRITVHDVIESGDTVVGRYTGEGTHQGDFLGKPGTGQRLEFNEIDIVRFRDGKIAEWWHNEDIHENAAKQLGAPLP